MADIFDADRIYFSSDPEMRVFGSEEKLAQWRFRMCGPPWVKIGRRVGYFGSDLNTHLIANRTDPNEVA